MYIYINYWILAKLGNSLIARWLSKVFSIFKGYIYYSKFDKGQNVNFVCRRLCISDTKNFMIDMLRNYQFTNMLAFVSVFCKLFLQRYKNHRPPIKLQCAWLLPSLILSFVPSHRCITLQKCTHNRTGVSLKSKTDFLKISEICDFW